MKLLSSLVYIAVVAVSLPAALGQAVPACPADLASSPDCADVINPNACYNEFGFRGANTLNCIEGTSKADKARKVGSPSPLILSCPVSPLSNSLPLPHPLLFYSIHMLTQLQVCKCCGCIGAKLCSWASTNKLC